MINFALYANEYQKESITDRIHQTNQTNQVDQVVCCKSVLWKGMLFACFFSSVKSVLFDKQHATPHQTHAFIRFQASIGLLLLSYTF
jgi:hypothetical protein